MRTTLSMQEKLALYEAAYEAIHAMHEVMALDSERQIKQHMGLELIMRELEQECFWMSQSINEGDFL